MGLDGDTNPYRYAYSNPLAYVDPDGRFPWPKIVIPYTCAFSVAREARAQGKSNGWRWAHCWAACEITRNCGGPTVARNSGYIKEILDLLRCGGEVLAGGLGTGPYCDSAYQPDDFRDNERGISCPVQLTCDQRCEGLVGRPARPGPFFGSGIVTAATPGFP